MKFWLARTPRESRLRVICRRNSYGSLEIAAQTSALPVDGGRSARNVRRRGEGCAGGGAGEGAGGRGAFAMGAAGAYTDRAVGHSEVQHRRQAQVAKISEGLLAEDAGSAECEGVGQKCQGFSGRPQSAVRAGG